jgi:hypothetical protein
MGKHIEYIYILVIHGYFNNKICTQHISNLFPHNLKSILHPKYSIQATPSPVIVARSSECPVSTNQFASILSPVPSPDTLHTKLVYEYIKGKGCLHEKDVPSCCLLPVSTFLPATYLPFAAHSLAQEWQGVCGKRISCAVV